MCNHTFKAVLINLSHFTISIQGDRLEDDWVPVEDTRPAEEIEKESRKQGEAGATFTHALPQLYCFVPGVHLVNRGNARVVVSEMMGNFSASEASPAQHPHDTTHTTNTEAKSRAVVLEMIGDLPEADAAPPANMLFICKLNPVTTEEDLEIIFSRCVSVCACVHVGVGWVWVCACVCVGNGQCLSYMLHKQQLAT